MSRSTEERDACAERKQLGVSKTWRHSYAAYKGMRDFKLLKSSRIFTSIMYFAGEGKEKRWTDWGGVVWEAGLRGGVRRQERERERENWKDSTKEKQHIQLQLAKGLAPKM